MPRYVAFLRGVSPVNCKMPALKAAFESAGFSEVKTLLSSGNVAFNARTASPATLVRKAEAAMTAALGRSFDTLVRRVDELRSLLDANPFAAFKLPADAKHVVTFLREAHGAKLVLPIELNSACILAVNGCEVFIAYVPSLRGPVFMTLIEKTFGKAVTTRTWDTVRKCAAA